MKRTLFFALLLLPATVCAQPAKIRPGHHRIALYASPEDSLRHLALEEQIDKELSRKPFRQPAVDSLMALTRTIMERMTFATIYGPGFGYILSDSIPATDDPTGIRKLCVYGKSSLPDVIWQCNNLEALELVNTSIEKLPAALNDLVHLKRIDIYNNRLSEPLRLERNDRVTTLTILNGEPGSLPRSYRKFRALEKLALAENGLRRFPNGARHNRELKELGLQRNALTLQGPIRTHRHLERLALHDNAIAVVPRSIRKLRNLKKLNFNSNRIVRVSPAIGKLKELEQLSFYNNRLTSIPAGVYALRELREIDLFHNRIESIGAGFVQWQKMHTLYLSHNRLLSLPANIDTLSSLTGLYIWDNRLDALPESVGAITTLKFLRVNNNYLKELPATVTALHQLEEIDISHNFITSLPGEIFDFSNLKIISVVNNPFDQRTRALIARKTVELRARDVFIHTSDKDRSD